MKYLLTFKPLKHFFFGNERTFRLDYAAVSEYFPQPSQLLGALRLTTAQQYGLIKQYKNGRYPKHPRQVTALTGTAKAHTFMHNDDLGKINQLSSMFIVKQSLNDAYFPTPFDVHIEKGEEEVSLSYCKLAKIGQSFYLEGYDVKNHSTQMLGNAAFWHSYMKEEYTCHHAVEPFEYDHEKACGIFVKHMQVGIGLKHKQTIEGAFYSKTDYTLAEGFLFAAVFDFDGELKDDIVQIGAESSLFEMKVTPLAETGLTEHPIVSRLFTAPENGKKQLALSDAMIPDVKALQVDFTLIPYLKKMAAVKMEKGRYIDMHKAKHIVPCGSIAYLKEGETLSLSVGAYSKMGYNQFITI
jgi:CRISPR type III-B/RAMP module-associated protein Cmr3